MARFATLAIGMEYHVTKKSECINVPKCVRVCRWETVCVPSV